MQSGRVLPQHVQHARSTNCQAKPATLSSATASVSQGTRRVVGTASVVVVMSSSWPDRQSSTMAVRPAQLGTFVMRGV
jgi:hypothetical protein